MQQIVADIYQEWEDLSEDHKQLKESIDSILEDYKSDRLQHHSYAVVGVFGSGKTQFLIHIFKKALEKGLLPIYLLAEDVFKDFEGTPAELNKHVSEFIESITENIKSKNFEEVISLLNADEGDLKYRLLRLLEEKISEIKHYSKVVVLLDELEGHYQILKDRKVRTKDGSPLREWLENKKYLKFIALAPLGVYMLGGADETRLYKLIIPPVDIKYLRKTKGLPAGKANSIWWISRGKARHIIKNMNILCTLESNLTEPKILEEKFDRIGEGLSSVPPVNIPKNMDATKLKYITDLKPIETDSRQFGLQIDLNIASKHDGVIVNKIDRAINVNDTNLSLKIYRYFKLVATALSDENYKVYIPQKEFKEFLNLVFDVFLEAEWGGISSEDTRASKYVQKVFEIIERIKNDDNVIAKLLFELNEVEGIETCDLSKVLPFSFREIRELFPLPIVSPTIWNIPDEVINRFEGKGLPFCRVKDDVIFFISFRDFKRYSESDEFKNKILPEGNKFVVILPEDDLIKFGNEIENDPFLKLMQQLGKLEIIGIPLILRDFILSIYRHEYSIPFDIILARNEIEKIKDDDLLTYRKFELYYDALMNRISNIEVSLKPKKFFEKGKLPGEDSVWGKAQLKDEYTSVIGLSLAFYNLPETDKENLAKLRMLFESKGRKGELADFAPKGGVTLANDLLPRLRKEELIDSSYIQNIRDYWTMEEKEILTKLALLLDLNDFKKLHDSENNKRVLEAFWRAKRDEFDIDDLKTLKDNTVAIAEKVEEMVESLNRLSEDYKLRIQVDEKLNGILSSLNGLKTLVKLDFKSNLPKSILKVFLSGKIVKLEGFISKYYEKIMHIHNSLQELNENVQKLVGYLEKQDDLLSFVKGDSMSLDELRDKFYDELLTFGEEEYKLDEIEREIDKRRRTFNKIWENVSEIEQKITEFKGKLDDLYNLTKR